MGTCLRSQQLVAELGVVMKKMNWAIHFEQKSPLKNLEAPTENEPLASRDDVTCKDEPHAKWQNKFHDVWNRYLPMT